MIYGLKGTIDREGAKISLLLTLDQPSKLPLLLVPMDPQTERIPANQAAAHEELFG